METWPTREINEIGQQKYDLLLSMSQAERSDGFIQIMQKLAQDEIQKKKSPQPWILCMYHVKHSTTCNSRDYH